MPTQNEREDAAERAAEAAFEEQERRAGREGAAVFSGDAEAVEEQVQRRREETNQTNRRNADAGTEA